MTEKELSDIIESRNLLDTDWEEISRLMTITVREDLRKAEEIRKSKQKD